VNCPAFHRRKDHHRQKPTKPHKKKHPPPKTTKHKHKTTPNTLSWELEDHFPTTERRTELYDGSPKSRGVMDAGHPSPPGERQAGEKLRQLTKSETKKA